MFRLDTVNGVNFVYIENSTNIILIRDEGRFISISKTPPDRDKIDEIGEFLEIHKNDNNIILKYIRELYKNRNYIGIYYIIRDLIFKMNKYENYIFDKFVKENIKC